MAKETLHDILQANRNSVPDEEGLTRVAVIGAGTMGLGIAHAVSSKGMEVLLVEKDAECLSTSMEHLEQNLDREIARWSMTEGDKRAVLSRIRGTTEFAEVEGYRLIVEAIPDLLNQKQELFSRLDALASKESVFVTNTSVLSVTELAEATSRPEKVIGMHFLHPVPKKALAEVVRGLKTSNATVGLVKGFAESIGKTVVEVYESPGFVTTRVILPMLNEAMYCLMEGVANVEGIDTAIRLGYDIAHGPLQLADQMGLDEVMSWLEAMFRETGEQKYRACPLLRKLVRAGHYGVKTGEGFHRYDDLGRKLGPSQSIPKLMA